jgi:uracil-DNA glycosylase
MGERVSTLLKKIRDCQHCKIFFSHLPHPVLNFSRSSKIVIIGQAPGIKVHESGIPWNDASGVRLRQWLGVTSTEFYDVTKFAIVPMGFCYPGKGKSGDLPPRPECANLWMDSILKTIEQRKLIILIGQYSQHYFLQQRMKLTLTDTVKNWREYWPEYLVLPHPSPRNNIWLKKNSWFEKELIPEVQKRIKLF